MNTTTQPLKDVLENIEAVRNALSDLAAAIEGCHDVRSALRGGEHMSDVLDKAPYELRNVLSDLEGAEGGWLMSAGESFREQMDIFAAWLGAAIDPEPDSECQVCGEKGTPPEDPVIRTCITPPAGGFSELEFVDAHRDCSAERARDLVR